MSCDPLNTKLSCSQKALALQIITSPKTRNDDIWPATSALVSNMYILVNAHTYLCIYFVVFGIAYNLSFVLFRFGFNVV